MRGFPVGSFVVCKRIEGQTTRLGSQGSAGSTTQETDFTHHLLDGQQRANAIALGYIDPISAAADRKFPAFLWLDLAPEKVKSPRRFLFRVTTKAHPWGFDDDEACSRLGVESIRKSRDGLEESDKTAHWPFKARLPIPLAWLLEREDLATLDLDGILEHLRTKIGRIPEGQILKTRLLKSMNEALPHLAAGWRGVRSGLARLRDCELVALEVPEDSLLQEDGETDDGISNVEALFTRLNSAGTPLEGAELTYSMIKAYWPEIEAKIDPLPRFVSPAHMASMAFRVALSDDAKLSGMPSISSMRRLAKAKDDDPEVAKKDLIREYLGLGGKDSNLSMDLECVNSWLLWNGPGDTGLPPFVRNELARRSPETMLLLLRIASRVREKGIPTSPGWRRSILGLATALHWFGGDSEKHRMEAANAVWKHFVASPPDSDSFLGILAFARNKEANTGMLELIDPENFDQVLPPVGSDVSPNWDAESAIQDRDKNWPCFQRLRSLRGLLLYAQRDFLGRQWADFDQADMVAWEDHNRPWDYDHILPSSTLYYKQSKYKPAGDEWIHSIGNLRACPLEKNRSKSDSVLESISDEERKDSLLTHEHCQFEGFSKTTSDFQHPEAAAAFMNAARSRMVRMYRDWYETLGVAFLLSPSQGS